MKKFSLYIDARVADTLSAAATAQGLRPAALIRLILERGLDRSITLAAPRSAVAGK
jgi:hypothetical protein